MPYTRREQEKHVSETILFKCVTRPDPSGVPLMYVRFLFCFYEYC